MKSIEYSPVYSEKIREISIYLDIQFGIEKRKKIFQSLNQRICMLQTFEKMGFSIRDIYGIDVDYRCIYAEHNFIFYSIEGERIYILDIYNEREDYMRKMFGNRDYYSSEEM